MPNPVGRPPLWTDPAELEKQIEAYFVKCDEGEQVERLSKRGEVVKYIQKRPYTLEGLGLHLGCETVTIREYGKKDEFSSTISRAKAKIYESWITGGMSDQYNPKITALCLAANYKPYNITQHHEVTAVTYEDKLRLIEERKRMLAGPDVQDAEIVSQDDDNDSAIDKDDV